MKWGRFVLSLALVASLLVVLLPAPAAAGTLPSYFDDALITPGLAVPRSLDFLPSGDILVAENAGTVQLIHAGTARQLLDFSADVVEGGEQGLLGVAVDPDFPVRPYVYFHYTASGSTSYVKVARFTFVNASGPGPLGIDAASKWVLIDNMPNNATNHNGGTVRFGPDKNLYISIGDDAVRNCDAQNLTILAGKILRIKVDDTINPSDRATLAPLDNPFIANPNPNAKLVWAYGLRNPFRFDIDPVDGRLYIGDVGQNSWEEVDISVGGENFGWPYFEGNHTYPGGPCAEFASTPPSTLPIYEYPNPGGASVIMAALYRGVNYPLDWSLPPAFEANPFFFDFSSGNLRVLRFNATSGQWGLVAGVTPTNFGTGLSAVTDMQVGPDGGLYYLTVATNELRRIGYQSQPTILRTQLPGAEVAVAYSETLIAGGNPGPYNWTLFSGALPTGLAINRTTGEIAGVPSAAGSFAFTIQVQSAAGRAATQAFVINVTAALQIQTATLPQAMVNRSYAANLSATGGVGPYAWAIASGSLPSGVLLSPSGNLSGSPTASGSFAIEVRVTDVESRQTFANLTLSVLAELVFGQTELPRGQVDVFYNATLTATGGTGPYTLSLASGSLPPGIAFNGSNATLWGLPTLEGVFDLSFFVVDSAGWNATSAGPLIIAPVAGGSPVIATTSLPDGLIEVSYSASLEVLGGTGLLAWTLSAGALPTGLALDAGLGQISGLPTAAGTFAFSIRVDDSMGRNDTRALSIRVIAPLRAIDLFSLSASVWVIGRSVDGQAIAINYSASNTTAPIRLTAEGLPPGLNLSLSGALSGTPTASGVYLFVVTATDSSSVPITGNRTYTVIVLQMQIITRPLKPGLIGSAYVDDLDLTGWSEPATWTLTSGELPPGLRLDASGSIRGTPTAVGGYTFTIEAREPGNSLNFDTRSFQLVVFQVSAPPAPASPPWVLILGLIAGAAGALIFLMARRRRDGDP